ncbi:hypothetical protein [Streptomyces sp. LN785]|uniref:hypothetical protein n=1 Tax=Streptomyces sp. LN785 TaxID=3112983 RepID=UPI003718FF00
MIVEAALACVPAPGRAGKGCEDHGALGPSTVVVVDGVGLLGRGCRHGVAWYARQLASATLAAVAGGDVPLADGLASAIATVAACHRDCDLAHPDTPSAAVGVLRIGADSVETLSLADVAIVVDLGTDGLHAVVDRHAEARAGLVGAGLAGHRIGTAAHAAAVAGLLAERETACNRPGGFWVAAADPDVAHRATAATFPSAGLRRAVVCSDGASWPVDSGEWTWSDAFARLASRGPGGLVAAVRELEAADPDGLRHPRVKRHDDATVAYLRVLP